MYRALLRLLPAALARRHGAAMEALFRASLAEAERAGGPRARRAAWLAGVADLLRRVPYEHARRLRRPHPGVRSMASTLLSDLRFAARAFVRQPGITFLVVLMLALGMASGTAVFSLVNGVFLRPLPFPHADRLVMLDETAPRWNLEFTGVNYRDFAQWREGARAFASMGVITDASYNLADGDGAERVPGAAVTWDYGPTLGIEPVLGRFFLPEEDVPNGPPVALIGHGLWQRRFAGAPDVLGRTLRVNGREATIVGVLPPEAAFPDEMELWLPLGLSPSEGASYAYAGVARLKPGVTLEQARADLARAHAPIWEAHDQERVVSPVLLPLRERLVGDLRPAALALGAAVVLVLLIACGNVAAILLARSFTRRRELAVRAALGASSGRIVRQLLTESLALALVAAPVGLLLGTWSIQLLARAAGDRIPPWVQVGVDWRLALFAVATLSVTAVLFGWAPILQARREDVRGALVEGSGRGGASRAQRRTMSALVVAEVALAALLLVSSGLLVRGFQRLQDTDPGFRTGDVLTFRVSLPSTTYPDSTARRAFYRELMAGLAALPGVRAAGAVTCPPLGCHSGYFFEVEGAPARGHDEPNPVVLYRGATPDYFPAMGVERVAGRFFDGTDDGVRGIVVNETFVRELVPAGRDAVGQRVRFHGGDGPWLTVIGVARDVRHYGLDEPMRPGVYFPLEARAPGSAVAALWTAVPPTTLVAPARALVRRIDPELPLYQVGTMEEALSRSLQVRRVSSWMMGVFAALALVLALGGIYGVLSYIVGQRGREIGIRLALGARRREVARLVVRQGMALAVAGVALGLLAALAVGGLLSGLLAGLSPRDPLTFGAVAAVLLAAAGLATLAPARRALRVEPQVALRED